MNTAANATVHIDGIPQESVARVANLAAWLRLSVQISSSMHEPRDFEATFKLDDYPPVMDVITALIAIETNVRDVHVSELFSEIESSLQKLQDPPAVWKD